jgi:hypothetical protein
MAPFSVEAVSSLVIRRLLACSHGHFSVETGSSLFIRRLLASSHDRFSVETDSSLFIRRLLVSFHGPFSVEAGSLLFALGFSPKISGYIEPSRFSSVLLPIFGSKRGASA